MKKFTSHIVILTFLLFSSFVSSAQDIVWDAYEIEIAVSLQNLDSHTLSATSSCSGNVDITWMDELYSGGCYGHIYRTYTATDDCGFSSTAFQIITIANTSIDVESPIELECSDPVPEAAYTFVSEDTEGLSVEITEQEDGVGCDRTITRSYVVTDACGNVGEPILQTINMVDTETPTIVGIIFDVNVPCNLIPDASEVYAIDNCTDDVTVILEETIAGDGCDLIITREWFAEDECGNSTSHTQTITTFDDQPPVLIGLEFLPTVYDVECDNIPPVPSVVAEDNCSDDLDVVFDANFDGDGCQFTLTRIWTSSDICGNETTVTHVINVTDSTAPIIYGIPDDLVVSCDEIPGDSYVVAYDNCSDDIDIQFEESIVPGFGCEQVITRTWTATDECGNTSMGSHTITVVEAPLPYGNVGIEISSIAPNPAINNSRIQFISKEDTHVILAIYDMNGRKINVLLDQKIEGNRIHDVDLNTRNLEEGIYLVRLSSELGETTKKIAVAK